MIIIGESLLMNLNPANYLFNRLKKVFNIKIIIINKDWNPLIF